MDEIINPLATICSLSLRLYSYRKKFAPQREQIFSCESANQNLLEEDKEIISASPSHSIVFQVLNYANKM